jgi:hypothetical protein
LLDRFRNGTLTDEIREKIQTLVKQLGDDDFEVRENATTELTKIGKPAMPLLLQASKSGEVEVMRRADSCIQQIDKDPGKSNPAIFSRLVGVRKPAGAAAALLGYRPFAHDEHSAEEIQAGLNAVAYRDGKADPVLIEALKDTKVGVRRAAAAAALAETEEGRQLPQVRACLTDKDAHVRLTVSYALARHKEREAFATLIDAMAEVPLEQSTGAEELLMRLAGEQAPNVTSGKSKAERTRYREAWATWWKANGPTIDLDRLDAQVPVLGYTLLVIPGNSKVMEIGRDGKTRWELNNLQYPFDAQMLPNGNVLVAEFHGRRVTERNMKGEVVWQHAAVWPIACQRLPNGNNFIATRNQIMEIDRDGKALYTIQRPAHDILAVRKLRNGEIGCVLNSQRYIRLDTQGKELGGFACGAVQNYVQFDVLPNGNVLIPQQGTNKVVEFDSAGKQVWEASSMFPYAAMRLSNGRTLVASLNTNEVVELDRSGKVVWKQTTTGPSWRARRR